MDAATVRPGTALDTVDSLDNGRVEILLSSVVTFITLPVQTETEAVIERVFPSRCRSSCRSRSRRRRSSRSARRRGGPRARSREFELVIIPDDPNAAEPEGRHAPKDILDGNNLELLLKNLPDGSYELRYRMGETGNPARSFASTRDRQGGPLRRTSTSRTSRRSCSSRRSAPPSRRRWTRRSRRNRATKRPPGPPPGCRFETATKPASRPARAGRRGAGFRLSLLRFADPDRASLATEIERTLSDGPAAASDATSRAALAGVPLLLAAWRGSGTGPKTRSAGRPPPPPGQLLIVTFCLCPPLSPSSSVLVLPLVPSPATPDRA